MRTVIDRKVVEMKFDNEQFKKRVADTMTTLDKLKEKLKLNNASKGLEHIKSIANNMHFGGLGTAIESIRTKFGALEIVGITAMSNIANSAVNAGKQLIKSVSIDQITAGMSKYEQKTSSVQTIMNATGKSIDDVNEYLSRLMWFSDETSYSFTDMTSALAQMTSSGGNIDKLIPLITGVANATAFAGKGAREFSSAMYNLNQSYSKGYLDYTDWKSIDLMGVSSKQLKQTIIDTAIAMKKIKKGEVTLDNFANTLSDKWADRTVMEKAFGEFSKLSEEAYKAVQAGEYDTASEAIAALSKNHSDLAASAFRSAQEAKSFTEAIDATKDAVSSGWMKTFEIIFGNYDEAKVLWTDLANAMWDAFASGAEGRNEMLQEWKDLGGRDKLIESFWNAWEAVGSIIKPIKEAFREIFPAKTAKQLMSFTERLASFTAKLKLSDKTSANLKSTFKGLFSVLKIGMSVFGKIAGGALKLSKNLIVLIKGFLNGTAAIGEWIFGIKESIDATNFFGKAVDGIVKFLQNGIDKLKEFGSTLKTELKADSYEGILGFFKALFQLLVKVGTSIGKFLGGIGKAIGNVLNENSFSDVLASGTLAGFFAVLLSLANKLKKPLDGLGDIFEQLGGKEGILENVKGILTDVRGCFEEYQKKLKSEILLKIASAIGILTASIWVLSGIDPEKLSNALQAITVLFIELIGAFSAFSSLSKELKGTLKATMLMTGMATSMLILAAAMKILSTMSFGSMLTALVGIAGGLTALIVAVNKLPEENTRKAAKSIRTLSISLVIFGAAMKIMASMSWNELARGLTGTVVGLASLVAAVKLLPKNTERRVRGMVKLSTALLILGSALKLMSSMSWKELARGLTAYAGALTGILLTVKLMPKGMNSKTKGILALSVAMLILGKAIKNMSSMSWEAIGRGLAVLGSSIAILSIGLLAMKGSLAGATALLTASAALIVLTIALKALGRMSWEQIGKSLVALAGAFVVIGVAGKLLTPLIPTLLSLAGATALFGVAALAIGAGLVLMGAGISAIAAALAVGATAIVAGLQIIIIGLLDLVPAIINVIGEALVSLAKVLGDSAPILADSLLKLVYELLVSLAKYTPLIVDALFDFLINVLNKVAERMPELVVATVKVIASFFQGVVEALKNIDTKQMLDGILAVGLLSGLIVALSAVASLIPMAMVGILGLGVIIAELALVLAAIGGLAQIPGLHWLISEGGDLLQAIGTAIGQFVGGIIGGIARGFTNSLPTIANDLSNFMKNIQPFIDSAKSIDKSIIKNVGSLVAAILLITGADLITSITSFFTGKNSLTKFSEQLVKLGNGIAQYSEVVKDIDNKAVTASATAAKTLAEVSATLPENAGGKNLKKFAKQLVPLGEGLKEYGEVTAGINSEAIKASAKAAKTLAEMTAIIPNEGGMVAWFTGSNSVSAFSKDLKHLGKGLKDFSIETAEIVPDNIIAASKAAKALAEMTKEIPNEGGMVSWFTGDNSVATFAENLKPLGTGLKDFSTETAEIVPDNIIAATKAATAIAEMTKEIPNEGGMVAWFTGDNSVATFAENLKPLGTGLKDFSAETAEIIPENVLAAANAAKAIAEMTDIIPNAGGVVSWFAGDNSVSTFSENLKPLGEGIKGFSDATDGIKPETVTAAANSAKALAEMTSIIPNEGGVKAWFSGESSIATFSENLKPLGEGIKGFSDAVTGITPETVTAGATAAKTLAEMAETTPKKTDKIISFGENLITFADKLKSYFDKTSVITPESVKVANDAITSINSTSALVNGNNVVSAGKAIGEFIKSIKGMKKISEKTVKGFKKAMTTLAETNISGVVKAFEEAEPKMKVVGASVIKKLEEGIKSREKATKDALKTISNAVSESITVIKEYYESFSDTGSYLVDGFCKGITNNTYKAKAKAKAMAEAAKLAAERALGIKSPSRVFYKIGTHTSNGFINALKDSTSAVFNASSNMGEYARKGMSKAISKITDVINSDMDTQPVIRPILDLTDIESGAGNIGGLFNSVSVGTNLNAISRSVNSKLQNGVNDDVISAINNLRKDLGNIGGNTYNVNGITYDDGSNITNAVRDLIRAAKIERRI